MVISVFDIGGSKIAFADIANGLAPERPANVPTPASDYPALVEAISGRVAPSAEAVGISIAGLVDPRRGKVSAANIPCLAGNPFRADLEQATGKPVFLINDANAFGLAEARCGAGDGHASVFAVILGTGVGGAIVHDGRLFHGAGMRAGEWGHGPASATRTGRPLPRWSCGCGQTGCLDIYGGARGLERLHLELTGETGTSFQILAAWEGGEKAAAETVDLYLDSVGGALAAVVNLIDPAIIVVGGGLSGNAKLLKALEGEMQARILTSDTAPSVVPARIAGNSALIGAALYAADELSMRHEGGNS